MEPDKEEWLAHRMLRVERDPVSWNKAEVWDRINDQIRPAPSRWYHVAATVIILLLLGSYFTVDDAPDFVREQKIITEYQSESKELISDPSEGGQALPPQKSVTPNKTRDALPQTSLSEIREDVVPIETVRPQKNEGFDSTSLSRLRIVAEPETQEIAEERIRPVIGLIYSDAPTPTAADHKRRKKLYKLESGESEQSTSPLSNTLILARKK